MRYVVSGERNNITELMLLFVGDPNLPEQEVLVDLVRMISPGKV